DRVDEVAVNWQGARAFGVHVGSPLTFGLVPGQSDTPDLSKAIRFRARVVGVLLTRDGVVPTTTLDSLPTTVVTPALFHRLPGDSYRAFDGAFVRLRMGASLKVFRKAAEALVPKYPETQGKVFVADEGEQVGRVERAISPQ